MFLYVFTFFFSNFSFFSNTNLLDCYQCDVCKKCLFTLRFLNELHRFHTGQKLFKRLFMQEMLAVAGLFEHAQRVHTGENI
jgi:hypothetical protein